MTSLSDFPPDVQALAIRIVGTSVNVDAERVLVAEGILAERERCEKEVYEPIAREITDVRYMLEAYRSMLGETALKVVAMWKAKRVKRVHHSWGPDAAALSGEARAALILEWEEAAKNGVLVENIDGTGSPNPSSQPRHREGADYGPTPTNRLARRLWPRRDPR